MRNVAVLALLIVVVIVAGWTFFLVGCGGSSWTDADTTSAKTQFQTQQTLLRLCQSEGGCTSGQLEVVENSATCNLGSMLARHGADVLDGGASLGCQP